MYESFFISLLCLFLAISAPSEIRAQEAARFGSGSRIIQIDQGIAPVSHDNVLRRGDRLLVELSAEPGRSKLPIVRQGRKDAAAGLLRRLFATGQAAGLGDVIYDNRDRGHSTLGANAFPQISRSHYDPDFVSANLDHDIAGKVFFTLPVIGNSSTAYVTGPLSRSLGRVALSSQTQAMRAFDVYTSNHLYVYPEHRDYDVKTGDRLFANVPYFVLSKGSSRSDKPFLEAFATIVAAFRPDTRRKLEELGLLAPTTQMILRRTLDGVANVEDYLSARAHPAVFSGKAIRIGRAISLANSMAPDAIPPLARLGIVDDLRATAGIDYLAENASEAIFTTPSAIARLWRSFDYRRSITLSAAETEDPNGRALTFHWVLLQGDPDHVEITALNENKSDAQISLEWQDNVSVDGLPGMKSSRVDIAVFADNGVWMSAPAVFSVVFPTFQNRIYGPERAGRNMLKKLDYFVGESDPYADPVLWPTAPWQDWLLRDGKGNLLSIQRKFRDGERQTVIPANTSSLLNRPKKAARHHKLVRNRKGVLRLKAFRLEN